ncbi:MAG: TIGR02300 family protein [Proteobacteria bacterium]|nr:TIGR02300 family protein [Pseudomonadota bacterium]
MAKSELGSKRLCGGCGAKFYDLNKQPITCPKCGVVFEIAPPARARPDAAARAAAQEKQAPEVQEAEFISLEDAEAEVTGKNKKKATVGAAPDADEDVEIDADEDDAAAFIEEAEEEDADVTDIIGGDVADEEET